MVWEKGKNRGTLGAKKSLNTNNQKGTGKEKTYVYTTCEESLNMNKENGMGKEEK